MKLSEVKKIVKEEFKEKGYSKYIDGGVTNGLTPEVLSKILLRIANFDKEDEDKESIVRGNKILDRANPDNVNRINKGEDPIYEELHRMKKISRYKKINYE